MLQEALLSAKPWASKPGLYPFSTPALTRRSLSLGGSSSRWEEQLPRTHATNASRKGAAGSGAGPLASAEVQAGVVGCPAVGPSAGGGWGRALGKRTGDGGAHPPPALAASWGDFGHFLSLCFPGYKMQARETPTEHRPCVRSWPLSWWRPQPSEEPTGYRPRVGRCQQLLQGGSALLRPQASTTGWPRPARTPRRARAPEPVPPTVTSWASGPWVPPT